MQPKQQLVELIEAYAAAKASGNDILMRMSATTLQDFVNQYELVALQTENKEED